MSIDGYKPTDTANICIFSQKQPSESENVTQVFEGHLVVEILQKWNFALPLWRKTGGGPDNYTYGNVHCGATSVRNRLGKMAEWSNAAVLKTVEQRCSGGSNPSLSAKGWLRSGQGLQRVAILFLRPSLRRAPARKRGRGQKREYHIVILDLQCESSFLCFGDYVAALRDPHTP